MGSPWTDAFNAWVEEIGGRVAAAFHLKRSMASIHGWSHGLIPRLSTLKDIEEKSGGKVQAALALQDKESGPNAAEDDEQQEANGTTGG